MNAMHEVNDRIDTKLHFLLLLRSESHWGGRIGRRRAGEEGQGGNRRNF